MAPFPTRHRQRRRQRQRHARCIAELPISHLKVGLSRVVFVFFIIYLYVYNYIAIIIVIIIFYFLLDRFGARRAKECIVHARASVIFICIYCQQLFSRTRNLAPVIGLCRRGWCYRIPPLANFQSARPGLVFIDFRCNLNPNWGR